jgi:hypothetical protein
MIYPVELLSQPNVITLSGKEMVRCFERNKKIKNDDVALFAGKRIKNGKKFILPHDYSEEHPYFSKTKVLSHIKRDGPLSTFYKTNLLSQDGTNNVKKAIIVPFERLEHLKKLFPAITVGRFESSDDFYFPPTSCLPTRCQYDCIIDMCNDDELWHLAKEPLITEQFETDVIIHVPYLDDYPERVVMETLAAKRWRECYDPEQFKIEYVRPHEPPVNNPNFLITAMDSRFETYRLPVKGGGMPDEELSSIAVEVEKVVHKLQSTFDGCGWFTGTPSYTILNFHTARDKENVLCEPGTEHLYALSVSSEQIFDWMMDRSVKAGRVMLVNAGRYNYCLQSDFCNKHHVRDEEGMEALYASGAEMVVFYCDGGKDSPADFKKYFAWLRETHPNSKQRCVMMESGLSEVYRTLIKKNIPRDVIKSIFR